MTKELAETIAKESGYSHWGIFPVGSLNFREEVRDMCKSDRCGKYGKLWTCPPALGSLEEIADKARKYDWGILLQTTGELEDSFDYESIDQTMNEARSHFINFISALSNKALAEDYLPMSSNGCDKCEKCTYPGSPCRFPDQAIPSIEAYGLIVNDVCTSANLSYYYGKNTITFSAAVLFRQADPLQPLIQ